MLILLISFLAAGNLTGCKTCPPEPDPCHEPVVIPLPPEPVKPSVTFVTDPDPGWLRISLEDARALAAYLIDLQAWIDQVKAREQPP